MVFQDSSNLNNVSKYIVDSTGSTPYTTIQSALDAANTEGGNATAYIRDGSYTEDLTMYDTVNIKGNSREGVTITGTHTPPASGSITITKCSLVDLVSLYSSVVAGTASLIIEECNINVRTGYVFDLLNWIGTLVLRDVQTAGGLNEGVVNNTAGASLLFQRSTLGIGSTAMIASGPTRLENVNMLCPITLQGTGSSLIRMGCKFSNTITTAGSHTTTIYDSALTTGASAAISHGSSSTLTVADISIDSAVNPCIGGAGVGNLILGSVTYTNNKLIAGTLTKSFATRLETGELKIDDADAGVLFASTGVVDSTGAMTNGQLVIGSTGVDPVLNQISGGIGISVTNGAGTISISQSDIIEGTAQTIGAVTADVITIAMGAIASAFYTQASVVAFESTGPSGAGYRIIASARTTGAAATLIGVPDIFAIEDAALSAASATYVVSGNNLIVRVTGVAGLTIDWSARTDQIIQA